MSHLEVYKYLFEAGPLSRYGTLIINTDGTVSSLPNKTHTTRQARFINMHIDGEWAFHPIRVTDVPALVWTEAGGLASVAEWSKATITSGELVDLEKQARRQTFWREYALTFVFLALLGLLTYLAWFLFNGFH